LRTAFTVEVAETASSIIFKFAKLLQSQEDSVSLEAAECAGKEMIACAKEGIFWTRIDFNVVIGRKPVYFSKTIHLPLNAKDVSDERRAEHDSGHLSKAKNDQSVSKSDESYAVREVGSGLATANIKSSEMEILTNPVLGNTCPGTTEKVAEEAMHSKKEVVQQAKNLLPHEMATSRPPSQPKKSVLYKMNAAAPSYQPRKLLPHEMEGAAPTQQEKKLLPHERVLRSNLAVQPPRRLLPHER
jgi:hypothetical protein